MATISIVHLSDLHFVPESAKKQTSVWEAVCEFINVEVRPHAVLVTGDVTDSAGHDEFGHAGRCLAGLKVRADPAEGPARAIVAGNHDRFFYRGNGTPPWYTRFGTVWWRKDKAGRFDTTFKDFPQVGPEGIRMKLDPLPDEPGVDWRLRVIGLDSCELPQWFAQGAVKRDSIVRATYGALVDEKADLVIALVHHHVLPIPTLEANAEEGSLRRALNFTGMLNSGTLLEAMSAAQVDLLLHGHEHVPHRAHYVGADPFAGRVAILSAGSGTGDATLKGWKLERVHFNVIELEDDRSVWLRQVSGESGQLRFVEHRNARVPLLRAEDIRASRFVRRVRRDQIGKEQRVAMPTSRLHKVVEFLPNRDILITESRTKWQVNRSWTHSTANGSGILSEALVRFDWDDGDVERFALRSVRKPNSSGRRFFALERTGPDTRDARRLTVQYGWQGGAVFTRAEYNSLPNSACLNARAGGYEFAAVLAQGEFESLQLTVRLPPQLAPGSENVQAFYQEPALDGGGEIVPSTEFGRGLEFCGEGHVELRVPHPIPGYRYGLRWPVRNDDTRGDQWHRLHAGLRQRHEDLRSIVDRALRQRSWRECCRVGIYLEDLEQIPHRLLCHGPAEDGFPFLTLRHERTLARCVYWGVPAFAFEPGPAIDATDKLADEKRLVVLPLLWSEQATHEALGVLRIAFLDLPEGVSEVAPWLVEAKLLAAEISPQVAALAGRA